MKSYNEIELLDSKLSTNQKLLMDWFKEQPVLTPLNAEKNFGISRYQLRKDVEELITFGHPINLIDFYLHPKIKTHQTIAYLYCGCSCMDKLIQSLKDHTNWSNLKDVA